MTMAPKHIGIVACSYEGAALCYREIGARAEPLLGAWNHPRITIDSIPMATYLQAFDSHDYARLADIMSDSINVLAAAGADFAICPDNSCHVALGYLRDLPIPFLSIIEAVAEEAQRRNLRRVAVLGTRFTMGSDMYERALASRGIDTLLPTPAEQRLIDRVIFQELVKGSFTDSSRARFARIIDRMAAAGCDSAALVCTEIPILISEHKSVHLLNSTQLLAAAALVEAMRR